MLYQLLLLFLFLKQISYLKVFHLKNLQVDDHIITVFILWI